MGHRRHPETSQSPRRARRVVAALAGVAVSAATLVVAVGAQPYTGTSYPAAYRGRYFFGDYVDQIVWTLGFDSAGQLTTAPETGGFGTGVGNPVNFAMSPGGDIVYADIGAAVLRRLVYAPGNAAPSAAFTTSVDPAALEVAFDASTSSDPNGDLLTFAWDFGDGTTATGVSPSHVYPATPDHFDVTLTVTDPLGASATRTRTVYPGNHPPSLAVSWPDPGLTYAVGDVVHASATATDQEDGPLVVSWSSRLEHCYAPTDCHQHYGATSTGPSLDLTVEGHEGDTRLWVTASATDSRGESASSEFLVLPRQRRITIDSTWPAGFTIGDEQTSSGLFTEGMVVTTVAPAVGFDGLSAFYAWGDASTDRVRQVTVGASDQTIEVEYRTPIDARLATDSAFQATMGASVGVEQGDLSLRSRVFAGGVAHWSPTTGVHYVKGAIGARYAALGGPAWCGPPTNDETWTVAHDGAYNHFARSCSIYWSPSSGTHWLSGTIRALWASLGWERSPLHYPTSDVQRTRAGTGWLATFQNGSIFSAATPGTHYLLGAVSAKYLAIGADASNLRYPTTNTAVTASGVGRYQHFQGGSIFWSSGTGAHRVTGSIRALWASLGWERSWLGYPTADVSLTPSKNGYVGHFQGGRIYTSGRAGTHFVRGAILAKYVDLKAEASVLRYPTTNTAVTASGKGRYQHFQGGSIFWSSATGAHRVSGAIRTAWGRLGWERSWLGYPRSDPFSVTVGIRQNFQAGYLVWNRSTGTVTARHY